jgi:hypothetical protein
MMANEKRGLTRTDSFSPPHKLHPPQSVAAKKAVCPHFSHLACKAPATRIVILHDLDSFVCNTSARDSSAGNSSPEPQANALPDAGGLRPRMLRTRPKMSNQYTWVLSRNGIDPARESGLRTIGCRTASRPTSHQPLGSEGILFLLPLPGCQGNCDYEVVMLARAFGAHLQRASGPVVHLYCA